MTEVHSSADGAATAEFAFAYIADYRNVTDWMFGFTKCVPVEGKPDRGLGAFHDATINLGPVKLHQRSELTSYTPNRLLGYTVRKGMPGTMTFRFTPTGPETCRVDVELTYHVPGGLAGRVIGKAMELFIGPAVSHSRKKVVEEVERRYRASTGAA